MVLIGAGAAPAKWRERQLKCQCHIWLLAFEGVSALRRVVQCSAGAIDRCKKLRWRGAGHLLLVLAPLWSATIPQTGESMTQFTQNADRQQVAKARICMPTLRSILRQAFRCGLYEAQDVSR